TLATIAVPQKFLKKDLTLFFRFITVTEHNALPIYHCCAQFCRFNKTKKSILNYRLASNPIQPFGF
ncbi:hypothetical protein, partial [Bizionia sp. APA-3]|uniref:hypothetical protein n=1 Tax=Bizionia sp. APA-3 TaxID=1861784 RepID=UPI001E50F177